MYLSKELNTDHLTVSITSSGSFRAPSLECSKKLSIQVIGSGDISCSKLQTERCDINIAGSGNIRVSDIQAEKLTGAVAGSGDLHLQGKARKAEYHQAGSGTIHAEECVAQDVIAKCIGNGEIYCRAEQTLDCKTDQGGKVFYKGNPQITTTDNNQPHRIK